MIAWSGSGREVCQGYQATSIKSGIEDGTLPTALWTRALSRSPMNASVRSPPERDIEGITKLPVPGLQREALLRLAAADTLRIDTRGRGSFGNRHTGHRDLRLLLGLQLQVLR